MIENDIQTLTRLIVQQGRHDFTLIPSSYESCVEYHEDASDYEGPLASRYEITSLDTNEFIQIFNAISDYKKYYDSVRYLVSTEHIINLMEQSIERYKEPCVILLISNDDILNRWRNAISNTKSVYFENIFVPIYHFIIFEYSEMKRMGLLKSVSENSIFFPCTIEVAKKFNKEYNINYTDKDDI